jgi:hypothetical protein
MIAETHIWSARCDGLTARCTIALTCAGVDLQIVEGETITRRERYADRSTAHERARALGEPFERQGYRMDPKNRRA